MRRSKLFLSLVACHLRLYLIMGASLPCFRRNDYGERLEAFFNPMVTGNYSFFVAADDQAEVHIAEGTNILDVET